MTLQPKMPHENTPNDGLSHVGETASPTANQTKAPPETALTKWRLNFDGLWPKEEKGGVVGARKPDDALTIDMKVLPDGSATNQAKHFRGSIVGAGNADVGEFQHPKFKAGTVAMGLKYTTRPSFGASLTVDGRAISGKDFDEILSAAREQVDFIEAKGVEQFIESLARTKFPNAKKISAHVTVKENKTTSEATTGAPLRYDEVTADRMFKLAVKIPTTDHLTEMSNQTTNTNESNESKENNHDSGVEATVGTKSNETSEVISEIKSAIKSSINTVLDKLTKDGWKKFRHENKITDKVSVDAAEGSLNAGINAEGEANLEVAKAKMGINVGVNLKGSVTATDETKGTIDDGQDTMHDQDVADRLAKEFHTNVESTLMSKITKNLEVTGMVKAHLTTAAKESRANKHVKGDSNGTKVSADKEYVTSRNPILTFDE